MHILLEFRDMNWGSKHHNMNTIQYFTKNYCDLPKLKEAEKPLQVKFIATSTTEEVRLTRTKILTMKLNNCLIRKPVGRN